MGAYSRRTLLVAAGTSLASALAGCSDGDEEPPGLVAVDVLTLHRAGDDWYDFPEEVGVQVTVENTDVDTHRGMLVVSLRRADSDELEWVQAREVQLPGGTTRGYRVVFDVGANEAGDFVAEATFESP